MDKGHVLEELSVYLDNQLSAEQKQIIEQHLQGCQECSQELARLKMLSEKLKAWQVPDLGVSFESAVRNEIVNRELQKSEEKMKKKTLIYLIPSSALAMILVILFFGYTFITRGIQGRLRVAIDEKGDTYGDSVSSGRSVNGPYDFSALRSRAESEQGEASISGSMKTSGTSGMYKEYNYKDQRLSTSTESNAERIDLAQNVPAKSEISPGEGSVIVIQPVLPATSEGEMVIRTANVSLEVADGKEAYQKAFLICQELGGYLASSNFYKDGEGRESGTITMRIPKDKFLTALDRVGALGKVDNSYSNSQDVSQEYANLKTQLDTAMIVYHKMLEALQKRQVTIPEAMRLESELTPIRQRIENIKNRIEYLNNSVSFTTITVNFHEPRVSAKVLKESSRVISEGMLTAKINTVKFFAKLIQSIPALIAIAVWLVILLGGVLLLKVLIIRIFKRG